ncbi:Hypothetical protein D9617_5g070600 [Elsinoe fawcettii]|nr:Hypothetical protein D9617_5g070600 [Elsinoe fawcettii]
MSTDGLSPPGSSQYDSGTLYVGDGTWDATRNSFLLPNLVGFNLATTQYNGMANRFRDLPGYQSLVQAHGAIASIIFLLLIPLAITIARFYQRNRRRAIHIHVWIQILVVFLLTVVLILGWFAVGPERSLTNPHHGIGVALYTLVLVQVIGGAIVRKLERRKDRDYVSIKLMLHHWFGRAIALLGLAQVPLGLALYGAPVAFFVVYALAVAAWILIWFVLSYRYQSERFIGSDYDGSYVSGRSGRSGRSRRTTEVVEEREEKKSGNFLRNTALLGGAFAGWKALKNRRRKKEGQETYVDETEIRTSRPGSRSRRGSRSRSRSRSRHSRHSRHTSGSYIEDEKLPPPQSGTTTWRNRILGAGAGLAAVEGVRRLFGKKDRIDEESDIGSYSRPSEMYSRPSGAYSRPPLGDNGSVSRTDISRVEAGQAPFSPADRRRTDRIDTTEYDSPLASPTRPIRTPRPSRLRPRRSGSFSSVSSEESYGSPVADRPSGGITKRQGLAATLAGLTGLEFFRRKSLQRRERKEERRAEELRRYDEEIADRVNRTQRRRPGFGESVVDETVHDDIALTGSNPALSRHSLPNTNVPPLPQSAAAPHSTITDTYSSTTRPAAQPGYPVDAAGLSMPTGPGPASSAAFPESNTSRVRFTDTVTPAATSAAAALASEAVKGRRNRRSSSLQRTDTYDTSTTTDAGGEPPVSVKVKIHDDNRHVTLRRLNSAEAAAEREARRRERRARRRQRAESLSSGLESDGGAGGYRRRVRPSATAPISNIPPPPPTTSRISSERITTQAVPTTVPGAQGPPRVSPAKATPLPGPPPGPPPVPVHSSPVGASSYGPSPVQMNPSMGGTTTGTGTEMSAFDDNRRRRRAERAAAKARALEEDGTAPRGTAVRGEWT